MKNDYENLKEATAKKIFDTLVTHQSKWERDPVIVGDMEAILVSELSAAGWKKDIAESYLNGRRLSDKQRWVLAFELVSVLKSIDTNKMIEIVESRMLVS